MSKIKDFVICGIFEHNFIESKEKDRRNTDVFQGLSTQQSVKFAEKICTISYENKFLEFLSRNYGIINTERLLNLSKSLQIRKSKINLTSMSFTILSSPPEPQSAFQDLIIKDNTNRITASSYNAVFYVL